ncbi:AraC family transcriptional regulator [Thiorhodococcus fuscus]|uniref:Helix-turn-helix domain-containing protein n=1 Tax=Thiorhodococcus fuscus TaxID=527200 RepID=A0ABW4YCE2_9GAMM
MSSDQGPGLPCSRQLVEIPGLEVLTGTFRNHSFPRHTHDGLMIALIDGGAQRLEHAGERFVAAPGQIVSMPAGTVHAVSPAAPEGWRYRVLIIPDSVMAQAIARPLGSFESEVVIEDRCVASRLAATHEALVSGAPCLEFEARLLDVVSQFLERYVRPRPSIVRVGREPEAVRRALDYLAARMDRGVPLGELAAAAELDGFRLTRAFTRDIGLPPHAWHLQCRLRRAQSGLAQGDSVVTVALATGFADQAHFTRAFKRLTGVTPGRYRADHGHPPLGR